MNMHRMWKKNHSKSLNSTAYMSVREKKAHFSTFEVKCEKPRRWGCFSISIALIGLVLLVAIVVTSLYVLLFTDLISHLFKAQESSLSSKDNNDVFNETTTLVRSTTRIPIETKAVRRRDLQILVLVVDTRTHNVDNNAYKHTIESWRKLETLWKDMNEKGTMTDRLSVMQCQGCHTVGIKEDYRGTTIFYSVEHLKSESHSFNTVVFVALPTPPGAILSTLTGHSRLDSLGEICQKGSWSVTGCDFEIHDKNALGERDDDSRQSFFNFRIQPLSLTETDLLTFNKTIVMQKDYSTFKVLISQPMAV